MISALKDRVVETTQNLFSHGPQPLEHTLDHRGDPGLLGPDSVSWQVIGDAAAFVGGIRALLVQTAHPEVVAGVEQHSQYENDPLGRLSRTARYVTETTYGAHPEVEGAVAAVRRAHAPVRGRSSRGKPYSASTPEMAAWVHNVLTDSFLAANQAYGRERLTTSDADRFVAEQARIGALLDADPLPLTAADLSDWITNHPDVMSTSDQRKAVQFLRNPPLTPPVKAAYRILLAGAVETIPESTREVIGVTTSRGAGAITKRTVATLRWALGSSPSWQLSLVRAGAPIPDGLFRQPLPPEAVTS